MDKQREIECVNYKHTELVSKTWNNAKYSLDEAINDVLPKIEKDKQKELEELDKKFD